MGRLYALTQLSLEEIALQFMDKGARSALKVYLLKKLDEVPAKRKAQRTLLCTWLTEIYLDEINGMSVRPDVAADAVDHDGGGGGAEAIDAPRLPQLPHGAARQPGRADDVLAAVVARVCGGASVLRAPHRGL